jgi:RHS repeat-associated protein
MSSRTIQSSSETFDYSGHQMTNADGNSLAWDENGQLITGVDVNLVWNWDGMLREANTPSKSISLRYDPSGNRIFKDSSQTGQRKYIVDIVGDLPVILMDLQKQGPNYSIKKIYIYANSQIIAQHDGDTSASRYFYLHDRLGSVRQIIDTTNGDVVKLYTYNPFGETLEEEGALSNPFMFAGQFYDSEINEYYLRARMYDPYISRFTARDPVQGKFQEPLTLHAYLYCGNDPVDRIDVFGRDYIDINFSWSYGVLRGAGHGTAWGLGTGNPWAVAGAAIVGGVLGGVGVTGGGMTDLDTGKFHFYGGGQWSSSLKGGPAGILSYSRGNVETGWNWGLASNVYRGYAQIGGTLFREDNVPFKEGGIALFNYDQVGISLSIFYVFEGIDIPGLAPTSMQSPQDIQNQFSELDLITQAVLLGQMIQDTGRAISGGDAGLAFWLMGVNVARQYGM